MDYTKFIVSNQKEESISIQRVKRAIYMKLIDCISGPVISIRYKLVYVHSEDSNQF